MAAVPGSLFRRILFWTHLCCGVTAGLFILVLSVTGVLLTYEKQLVAAATQSNLRVVVGTAVPLTADRMADIARAQLPPDARASLVFDADPRVPVKLTRGRDGEILLDPYTGAVVPDAAAGARAFFRAVEDWHRWLAGDPRSTRANLIDVANLAFVFLVTSGLYLWLPAVWRWRTLKGLLLFRTRYINGKVRDFSWHHVFGIWALLPLFLISVSGVVISYPWASNLVYAAFGEAPPQRGGPPGAPGEGVPRGGAPDGGGFAPPGANLAALLAAAQSQLPGAQRYTVPLMARGGSVDIVAELPSTSARPPRRTVTLDAADARVLRLSPLPAATPQSPGQRARVWFRFIHTGEQYGLVGQTLAGLASLAACFLVYTGLALAFRRLILPRLRRRGELAGA